MISPFAFGEFSFGYYPDCLEQSNTKSHIRLFRSRQGEKWFSRSFAPFWTRVFGPPGKSWGLAWQIAQRNDFEIHTG